MTTYKGTNNYLNFWDILLVHPLMAGWTKEVVLYCTFFWTMSGLSALENPHAKHVPRSKHFMHLTLLTRNDLLNFMGKFLIFNNSAYPDVQLL